MVRRFCSSVMITIRFGWFVAMTVHLRNAVMHITHRMMTFITFVCMLREMWEMIVLYKVAL